MHFALAQTPGGRPTTVTTTAMPDGSPRTSAVPAPSVFLPRAEPSTSRSAGASSAGTSTGPDADGPTDGDCDFGGSMMDDDYDMSSEDEYERSGSTFTIAVGMYSFERNLIETPYIHLSSKPVIEYVNLKFVENNFRTLGIDRVFDKNNIMRAELEFESFEVWFSHVKEYAIERDCIRDLRLPLFCHLYLNLYAPHNHTRLHQFLKAFQYIFTSPRGSVYLDELRKVTDILDLSPRLAYFRRNKFVYGVSPMFLNNLYNFFQFNYMLQLVFQEWFDINYIAYEDPKVVFEDYYTNRLVRVNNLVKANAPKINNNVNTLRTVLWKKTLNSSQNQNNRKVNNYENEVTNNRKKSRKHRKKHKSRGKKKSTPDCLQESSNDTSNNEEQLRKKIKSSYRKKSTSDPDSRLCEESSEVSINEEKKYKRQKKSGRSKSTNDDNNTQTNESSSEVSNEEKKMHKRQKKSIKSKSISDVDMHSGLSDISNDDEKTQKLQNKRSKTQSTIDDNNHTISEDEESPIKDKKNYKSNDRRKYEHIDKDSTLSDSYSAEDSLEDSSSLYSTCDEEIEMRKYVRNNKKSAQRLRYETSRRLKHMKITKIDYKNLDEDLDLSLSRKIILKNCSKVSCSILTIDQNLVIAGSIDSLIYLWERDNKKSESDRTYNLHNIENINPSNSSSSVQGNDFIEYLDKSTAFVLRGHSGPIFDLAELPSAKILVSASNDKTYRAWDMVSKRCLEVYNEHEHRTWCIAACPYSLQVATGSCEGASCLWFLNYKRPLRIFMGHLDDILVLKFHPNQVLLATGSSDKTIRVFELTTGECHRVLIGHSDYITCLEFNVENANYLASASGSGEIVVWDVPTGEIVWKIRVGNVFFTDLAWLNADILLVSLTSGVVLKCDTTLNYLESSCKVIGFDTPFDRLISLKMINNIVYTIGIPDKSGSLKPMPKRNREKASQMKSEQRKSQRELSPLSKLFFPQHIIDNNGNSKRPLRGLSSTIPNPTYNFEYQINNDQLKKSTLPNFLSMNLRSAPFNLTAEEISKLSSEYQSENIRLIPAVTITNNLQNAYLLPVQPNVRTSNSNSTNLHPTNVQLPSTSKSQKLNKTQGPSKSKITTAKQHNFGNSSLTMHTSIQHMQIKTTTAQEQLHLDDHRDTNMLVQQYLQTTSTNTHKQQTSNLLQVTHPGMSSQVLQNSIVQQDQQVQLQHDVGSNSNLAGTNVQQQQLIQNLQSNTNLTKGNVQQRLSPQTNNRSSNTNVTKRPAPRKSPNK